MDSHGHHQSARIPKSPKTSVCRPEMWSTQPLWPRATSPTPKQNKNWLRKPNSTTASTLLLLVSVLTATTTTIILIIQPATVMAGPSSLTQEKPKVSMQKPENRCYYPMGCIRWLKGAGLMAGLMDATVPGNRRKMSDKCGRDCGTLNAEVIPLRSLELELRVARLKLSHLLLRLRKLNYRLAHWKLAVRRPWVSSSPPTLSLLHTISLKWPLPRLRKWVTPRLHRPLLLPPSLPCPRTPLPPSQHVSGPNVPLLANWCSSDKHSRGPKLTLPSTGPHPLPQPENPSNQQSPHTRLHHGRTETGNGRGEGQGARPWGMCLFSSPPPGSFRTLWCTSTQFGNGPSHLGCAECCLLLTGGQSVNSMTICVLWHRFSTSTSWVGAGAPMFRNWPALRNTSNLSTSQWTSHRL